VCDEGYFQRREERRYLVHDLVGHLLAHGAGHFDIASIQVERLVHDDAKVGAAQARQVAPEEFPSKADRRQQGRTAAQCQEHDARMARL